MITRDDLINVRLLAHPANWLVVWTVLLFGSIAWHLIMTHTQSAPFTTTEQNQ